MCKCSILQHDSTVAAFLSALRVFNDVQPPYASTVLVELFNTSGQFSVQVWYRNDSDIHTEPFQLTIPGQCALSTGTSNGCRLGFCIEMLSTINFLLNCCLCSRCCQLNTLLFLRRHYIKKILVTMLTLWWIAIIFYFLLMIVILLS